MSKNALDGNTHENYFAVATASETKSWWDSIVDTAGGLLGSLPPVLDGMANLEEAKNTNTTIVSKDPNVAADANARRLNDLMAYGTYAMVGVATVGACVLLWKAVKG